MFTVEGYRPGGIAYKVMVGVHPRRANDGIVAGDPNIIGILRSWEGIAKRPHPGATAISENATTMNPDWVLACLHAETEVINVEGNAPTVGSRKRKTPPGVVY